MLARRAAAAGAAAFAVLAYWTGAVADAAYVPSSDAPKTVVWAVGDGGDGGENGLAVAALIAARGLDRFLYLGDVYEHGTADEFAFNYQPLYGGFDGVTAPTIGNHEWPTKATGYDPYWAAVYGEAPPEFYEFSLSGWQLLSLNSEADHGADSAQAQWLAATISSTPGFGDCRIAFLHRPRYSAGVHGDSSLAPLWEALEGNARIFLSGHDHNMQRFKPRHGLVQLVSGAGGHELFHLDPATPHLRFAEDEQYGALRLSLTEGRAGYRFISVSGKVLDRGRVRC